MYGTPTKLADDGITTDTFSADSTRKLAFFYNTSRIFAADNRFRLFNIFS